MDFYVPHWMRMLVVRRCWAMKAEAWLKVNSSWIRCWGCVSRAVVAMLEGRLIGIVLPSRITAWIPCTGLWMRYV